MIFKVRHMRNKMTFSFKGEFMDKKQKDQIIDLLDDFESWLGGIDMLAKTVKSLAHSSQTVGRLLNLQEFSKHTSNLRNKVQNCKLTLSDSSNNI
jgi:archaellum component FlaC